MADMNRARARVGVVGMPCVAMGATEDTNRDCSSEKADPIGGSAQVVSSLSPRRQEGEGME